MNRFPQIVFKSTEVKAKQKRTGQYLLKLTGDLTLHGITRPVRLTALLTLAADSLRARGQFRLKQKAFGMKPVSAGGGTVKVSNELEFAFDIRGHRVRTEDVSENQP